MDKAEVRNDLKPPEPGTPIWAARIASIAMDQCHNEQRNAIATELMYAYAQGYQDGKRESSGERKA